MNVTSDKCYENREPECGYREDESIGGHDPYSTSKAASELVTASYRALRSRGGAALATARAGNVIGGGDWGGDRLDPRPDARGARRRAGASSAIPTPSGPGSTSSTRTAAICCSPRRSGTIRASQAPGTSAPTQTTRSRCGRSSSGLPSSGEREIEVQSPEGDQPHEAETLRLDSSRARSALGWRPQWDLDRALASIVDWYRVYTAGGSIRDATLAQIREYSRSLASS